MPDILLNCTCESRPVRCASSFQASGLFFDDFMIARSDPEKKVWLPFRPAGYGAMPKLAAATDSSCPPLDLGVAIWRRIHGPVKITAYWPLKKPDSIWPESFSSALLGTRPSAAKLV